MIPNQVLEQLAVANFDKEQMIIVMKNLLGTAENARAQAREEMRQELAEMRSSFGRLIIEAVEATEAKIFARLEEEKAKEEEKKRLRREASALRKKEREALAKAAAEESSRQTEMFVEDTQIQDRPAAPDLTSDYNQPVTGHLAAKFDENQAFKELKAQLEARALQGKPPTKPIGSPLAAVQSLGEALAAGWEKELQERQALEREQGGQDMLMIEQTAPGEMLQAAE